MSLFRRALVLTAGVATTVLGPLAPSVSASPARPDAVYVLSNQPAANEVLVFDRADDGTLSASGAYDTGGVGTGGGLGSQGAVVLDGAGRYLYAVNAGSGTISSFRVGPDGLHLVDVESSGGTMPTSLTVHGELLYVLNAGDAGGISGFRVHDGDLRPMVGSARPLSGDTTAPAQVSFTPDGRQLLVTERATQLITLFNVNARGYAMGPIPLPSAGATPFGFGFDDHDHVIVSEAFGGAADASAVSSYKVNRYGLPVLSASVPTTETAACWIAVTEDGRFAYAGNAGAASITGYRIGRDGRLTILDADGKTASAASGVTDLAISSDGDVLYGRIGDGTVGSWAIGADGSLQDLGAVPGLPAGAAGIAAS